MKLLDMTRHLIRLTGHIRDVEIPITFIEVRPGEKPHKELVEEDGRLEPSGVEKIPRVQLACLPQPAFQTRVSSELKCLAMAGKLKEVIELLCEPYRLSNQSNRLVWQWQQIPVSAHR